MLGAGCPCFQLRQRGWSGLQLFETAVALRRLADENDATLIVNDRVDIALACGADGVHLPAAGLAPEVARGLLSKAGLVTALLGVSVHSLAEIESLGANHVDYVQFGPVFETPSKAKFGAAQGLDRLVEAVALARSKNIAVIAVGGINADNSTEVRKAGAKGVAVIRALSHPDTTNEHVARLRGDRR